MSEKRFKVHIDWFNYEKTEGAIELKDNGQPLLISESVEDVRYIKNLLNELHEENKRLQFDLELEKGNSEYYKQLSEEYFEEVKKLTGKIINLKEEIEHLKEDNKMLRINVKKLSEDVAYLRNLK